MEQHRSPWVEGEVASLSRASSGHQYFSLKDNRSQVRVIMWRSDAARLKFELEEGLLLLVRGTLGVYGRDGKFQMYAQTAVPAGLGADAVMVGRAYLYGVGAGGKQGVDWVLDFMDAGLSQTMSLVGTTSIDAITSDYVCRSRRN